MASKFGRSNSGFSSKGDREKFLFIAAAGTALAVVIIVLLVTSLRANQTQVAETPDSSAASLATAGNVYLLAPESDVPANTKLSDVRYKKVEWPKIQLPEGAFTDASEVANLYSKNKLIANLPIQRKDTATQQEAPSVTTVDLTPGNRAVTIDVDDTSGLEGHALPGTHVDVVLTYSQTGNLISEIIVENARVLSYGGDRTSAADIMKEHRPARTSRTITLDVGVQDALKIQTSRQLGRITLLLRSAEDQNKPDATVVTANDVGSKKNRNSDSTRGCSKGRIKIGGKDYIMGCDGAMSPVN